MGIAAEHVAKRYGITRDMQDVYACLSYKRTLEALEKGYLQEEIIPISFQIKEDETIKRGINYERIIKRTSPAFYKLERLQQAIHVV